MNDDTRSVNIESVITIFPISSRKSVVKIGMIKQNEKSTELSIKNDKTIIAKKAYIIDSIIEEARIEIIKRNLLFGANVRRLKDWL